MPTLPRSTRLLLPLAISAAMVACGGGGGGGGGSNSSSLQGSASKGIVMDGIVNAYAINSDGTISTTKLADETRTAADGTYSLVLNSNYTAGTPVYVEITADSGTTMRCDLVQCGTDSNSNPIVFGDSYPLASTFKMAATLPSASGSSIAVNITPLTDAASQLTLKKIAAGADASAAALSSNAQLADRLGLTGSLLDQPIVDITQASAVNSATKAALEYNLKAAAAVAAGLAGGASVEDAVASFASQFANSGLADKESTPSGATTLEELLEQAIAILDKVKTVDGVDGDDVELNETSTSVAAAEAEAQNNGSETASQGEVADDIGSEGLVAAKGFVNQLRNLANAGAITENQQAFADEIDLAASAIDGDSGIVAEGLALAIAAIGVAWEEYGNAEEGSEPSSVGVDVDGDEQADITVSITSANNAQTYTVEQDVTVAVEQPDGSFTDVSVAVDVSATDGTEFTDTTPTTGASNEVMMTNATENYGESGEITADLSISGSASTTDVRLSIDDGSSLSGSLKYSENGTEEFTDTSYSDTWDNSVELSNIDASLSVTLSQLTGDNPVSFTGGMSFKLAAGSETDEGSYSESWGDNYEYSENSTVVTMIDGLDFALSGDFSDSNGNSLNASLAASLGNFSETCTESGFFNSTGWGFSYECTDEETEESFATASLSIMFSLNLAGINDDIAVDFSASRTGLETGSGSIELSYGGKQLNLDYPGANAATLSNHNGVSMTLTETETEGVTSVSGTIMHGGSKFADVSEESGAVIIRYTDGTFETAM